MGGTEHPALEVCKPLPVGVLRMGLRVQGPWQAFPSLRGSNPFCALLEIIFHIYIYIGVCGCIHLYKDICIHEIFYLID